MIDWNSSLREVAGAEAPLLKKFSSKVQGKLFPFSYLTISNFSMLSAGWQVFRARTFTSSEETEIEILISLSYGNYP